MDIEKIERIVDAALIDGIIEAECTECGNTIQCEPDALTAWCEQCGKVVSVNNLLRKFGLI